MLLTITNTSGVERIIVGKTVAHLGTFTFNDFHNEEYLEELRRLAVAGTITMTAGTLASGETEEYVADIDATADPAGGVDTALVGFQMKNKSGVSIAKACVMVFGVYDDTNGITAAAAAVLTAVGLVGTILSGVGTAELIVVTDANGKFTCTLSDANHETVYLKCGLRTGSVAADVSDVDSVTFTA